MNRYSLLLTATLLCLVQAVRVSQLSDKEVFFTAKNHSLAVCKDGAIQTEKITYNSKSFYVARVRTNLTTDEMKLVELYFPFKA